VPDEPQPERRHAVEYYKPGHLRHARLGPAAPPATVSVNHPIVGLVTLERYQLGPVEYPELLLVLHIPVTDEDLRKVLTAIRHSGG
jgi:hypothetical protein